MHFSIFQKKKGPSWKADTLFKKRQRQSLQSIFQTSLLAVIFHGLPSVEMKFELD